MSESPPQDPDALTFHISNSLSDHIRTRDIPYFIQRKSHSAITTSYLDYPEGQQTPEHILPPELTDERLPNYLSRILELSPTKKLAFYESLGKKAAELRKLYFDNSDQLHTISAAEKQLAWLYDGKVGKPLPDWFTPSEHESHHMLLIEPNYKPIFSQLGDVVAPHVQAPKEFLWQHA